MLEEEEKERAFLEDIHEITLNYIDNDDDDEKNRQILIKSLNDYNITQKKHDFELFLCMISNISKYHFRGPNFFAKIEKILRIFKEDIKLIFSQFNIFQIFKGNKKIILFLIKEKILETDFLKTPDIENYLNESDFFNFMNVTDENIEKQKRGENDHYICELIRKDLIDEFIIFVNQNCIDINSLIAKSIFETNASLIKSDPTIIQYAAFFGSLQIFKYLQINGADLKGIYKYAIHGRNPEIITSLEKVINEEDGYISAVKCHHNEIADYFMNNMEYSIDSEEETKLCCFKYYNFSLIDFKKYTSEADVINNDEFKKLCEYNYYDIVVFLLHSGDFKIDAIILTNIFFL